MMKAGSWWDYNEKQFIQLVAVAGLVRISFPHLAFDCRRNERSNEFVYQALRNSYPAKILLSFDSMIVLKLFEIQDTHTQ